MFSQRRAEARGRAGACEPAGATNVRAAQRATVARLGSSLPDGSVATVERPSCCTTGMQALTFTLCLPNARLFKLAAGEHLVAVAGVEYQTASAVL